MVECGEEPGPYLDSDVLEMFKTIAPTFIRDPEKIHQSDKFPEEVKPALVALAILYKLLVAHMDRRHHLLGFFKCERKECAHCSANPISEHSKQTLYEMMKQHNGFFDVIPDPNRPGHHLRLDDVLTCKESLGFKENGQKLPSKQRAAAKREEKYLKEHKNKSPENAAMYGYECPLCMKSTSGSPYRRYIFHITADADRHRIIFHRHAEMQLQRAVLGKKRGRPLGACTEQRTLKSAKPTPISFQMPT